MQKYYYSVVIHNNNSGNDYAETFDSIISASNFFQDVRIQFIDDKIDGSIELFQVSMNDINDAQSLEYWATYGEV